MSALGDIAAERKRQIEAEGWTAEHDDTHTVGDLACAAGCYAIRSSVAGERDSAFTCYWPWHQLWWKPGGDERRMLVKAGALIVAEIERLDRAQHRREMEALESRFGTAPNT